jgi:AraC-like DNA-binding protein
LAAEADVAELLVRGSAAGAFVLLALGVIQGGRTPARVTGALFCLAAAAHTLTQSPIAVSNLGFAFGPVWVLSVMGAGLFWAFAIELFGDNQKLAPWRFAPAAALLATAALAVVSPPPAERLLWLGQNLIGGALLLHVLLVVWIGGRGDLVEARRRVRGPLLGAAALYALAVVAVQSAELFSRPAAGLSMVAATVLLALSVASGAVFLRADERLFGPLKGRATPAAIEPPDQRLLVRLHEALHVEEVWREEGLTIRSLAAKLGAPEHHLRRLVNEHLGYRNFAAFINEHRIEAAKRVLADPAQARTTIAVVAFDVGFGSLGPFNRAFREGVGQTPTAWRRATKEAPSISEVAG